MDDGHRMAHNTRHASYSQVIFPSKLGCWGGGCGWGRGGGGEVSWSRDPLPLLGSRRYGVLYNAMTHTQTLFVCNFFPEDIKLDKL